MSDKETDAVEILKNRYIKGKPKREISIRLQRAYEIFDRIYGWLLLLLIPFALFMLGYRWKT